nr:zinc metallopeptidase [Maliibacterium massiliense]
MLFYPIFDWTFLILIPGLIFGMWAQSRINRSYQRYSRVLAQNGVTGARLAQLLLHSQGIDDVPVEISPGGGLSDHYDPRARVLRLSQGVYNSSSIAALGIAAHEVGHAYQHQEEYAPLKIRNALAPVVSFASTAAIPLLLIGLFAATDVLITIGLIAYASAVVFQLVTLPVEFNASRRAIAALETGGYLSAEELPGAKDVLSSAAMTYVAAALASILQLLRLSLLFGRRND